MSSEKVRIRYDGPALAGHSIDVDDLAPALLAIGELCKLANKKFNGDRAAVKVLVNADLDQSCFELNLELVQSLFDHARLIIGKDDVATAKEILEWLGIISASAGSVYGLYELLKVLKNRQIESTKLTVQNGTNVTQVHIKGDNNVINVHPQTGELFKDPAAISNVQKTLKPLAKDGYESLWFETEGGDKEGISKNEAKLILNYHIPDDEEETPQEFIAWVEIYSPVYSRDAGSWRFLLNGRAEHMDISDTDIASKAMERGGTSVGDAYKVNLIMVQKRTASNRITASYKIKDVLDFRPSTIVDQRDLLEEDEPQRSSETE